jgi:hypothetical protein
LAQISSLFFSHLEKPGMIPYLHLNILSSKENKSRKYNLDTTEYHHTHPIGNNCKKVAPWFYARKSMSSVIIPGLMFGIWQRRNCVIFLDNHYLTNHAHPRIFCTASSAVERALQ